MCLEKKREEITKRLDLLGDPISQCDYLMMEGISRDTLSEIRKDEFRVGGCKTAIWVRTALIGNRVRFEADSDSLLVRGVLSLFDELYADAPVTEACKCPPLFTEHISEEVIYRDIKDNGLRKCYLRIQALQEGETQ